MAAFLVQCCKKNNNSLVEKELCSWMWFFKMLLSKSLRDSGESGLREQIQELKFIKTWIDFPWITKFNAKTSLTAEFTDWQLIRVERIKSFKSYNEIQGRNSQAPVLWMTQWLVKSFERCEVLSCRYFANISERVISPSL